MPDLEAARIGDMHACPSTAPGPTSHVGGPITTASSDIFIENAPAARTEDQATCVVGGPDVIAEGSKTVLFNDGRYATRNKMRTAHNGRIVTHAVAVWIGGPTIQVIAIHQRDAGDAAASAGAAASSPGDNSQESSASSDEQPSPSDKPTSVHAEFLLILPASLEFGKPAKLQCRSWDPDTGGTRATPNPASIRVREWSILLPDGVLAQSGFECNFVVPELESHTPVPLEIMVRLRVEDADDKDFEERSYPVTLNIVNPVTRYGQPTNMTCWSAAATMLMGSNLCVGPGSASTGSNGGLIATDSNIAAFAQSWGLRVYPQACYTVAGLARILRRGPAWIGGFMPKGHAVVFADMRGDGTPLGTAIRVYDPWPVGLGSEYEINYQVFMQMYPTGVNWILQR
jgi:uncharacterized Zn-binding protein involved in type VI secretion